MLHTVQERAEWTGGRDGGELHPLTPHLCTKMRRMGAKSVQFVLRPPGGGKEIQRVITVFTTRVPLAPPLTEAAVLCKSVR